MDASQGSEPVGGPGAERAAPSAGRAFAVYTGLRLLVLVVTFALLSPFVGEPLLALGGAVLVSALASVVLLRSQRQRLTEATMARAEARRAERERRRARLDDPPAA